MTNSLDEKENKNPEVNGAENEATTPDSTGEKKQNQPDEANSSKEDNVVNETEEVTASSENAAKEEALDLSELNTSEMSLEELYEVMEKITKAKNPLQYNKDFQNLKKLALGRFDEEREKLLAEFTAAGNDAGDFKAPNHPLFARFQELFKQFSFAKKEEAERQAKEKEANLAEKKAILEELKELTDDVEVKDGYNRFQKLQEKWKQVGHVPITELDELNRSYKFMLNKFYDNMHIYRELLELDRQKNLERKQKIVDKVNELATSESINDINRGIRDAKKEWSYLGPVTKAAYETLEAAFTESLQKAEAQKEKLEKERAKELSLNLEAKKAVIEKIKSFVDFEGEHPKDWAQKNDELAKWIEEWKKIGFVPLEEKDRIYKAFNESVRAFNSKKNEFFKAFKKQRADNLAAKEKLIDRTKAILEEEDLLSFKDEMIELQKKWKDIGPVPPKKMKSSWQTFRGHCDDFFDRLGEKFASKKEAEKENLTAKEALIKEVKTYTAEHENIEEPEKIVSEFQNRFKEIGFVPIKAKDKISKHFNDALKALIEKSGEATDIDPEFLTFKIKMDALSPGARSKQIRSLQNKIGENRDKIASIETNLGFFNANSKSGAAMLKDYEKEVEVLKKRNKEIQQKIKVIKNLDQ